MKFTLEIVLGNEAMQDGNDVARALESIAKTVEWCSPPQMTSPDADGIICDRNGNTVGKWSIDRKGGG